MSGRGVKQPAEPQPPRRNPARVCRSLAGAAPGGPPAAEATGTPAAAARPLAAGPEAAAGPPGPDWSELLPEGVWTIVAWHASGRDAVMLSSTCRRLRPLFDWARADGAFQPVEGPDGTLQPPASGRGCLEVRPGDDLQAAVDRCPEGGAIMLAPGTYLLPAMLRINRGVHLCGGGRATLDGALLGLETTMIESTAARASVDGLVLQGDFDCIDVAAGDLQVSACDINAASVGVKAGLAGVRCAMTCIRNQLRGKFAGLMFYCGATGRVEHNTVRDCDEAGIWLCGVNPSLRVAHNSAEGCGVGIRLGHNCPAAFALGPGNELRGNERGDIDDGRPR